ncbi:MAG: type II toxin-antitoxin system PemK/MazF family toxin [Oceanicaulis sp.]
MAIKFPPKPGLLLLCDYSLGGFRPPEMVKRRPAIVLSPRLRHRENLVAVVPLSESPPARDLNYVVGIELHFDLPSFPGKLKWAKCDMVATVGFFRLDLFRTARMPSGKRKYLQPILPAKDLERVKSGVRSALGLKD